jgi:hypothetical protein
MYYCAHPHMRAHTRRRVREGLMGVAAKFGVCAWCGDGVMDGGVGGDALSILKYTTAMY